MNFAEIIAFALQVLLTKSASFTAYVNGVKRNITVAEVGPHTTPVGSFSFTEALQLAAGVFSGALESKTVRIGADDYAVTVA